MEPVQKLVNILDTIFVTFKVTTRDLYVIPCAHIREYLSLALMITAMSVIAAILELPVFLDYRGCIVGILILCVVYLFTKK